MAVENGCGEVVSAGETGDYVGGCLEWAQDRALLGAQR